MLLYWNVVLPLARWMKSTYNSLVSQPQRAGGRESLVMSDEYTARRRAEEAARTERCDRCGQRGSMRPIADRLLRCEVCDFVLPVTGVDRSGEELETFEALAVIAPGGVLREKYRLQALLGRGAHGVTFLAEHLFLGHSCVVKILPHQIADAGDTAVRRLRSEAQAGYRVNHDNVVRVLDCDRVEGYWYFVMEYVDGVDLGYIVQQGITVSWQQAIGLAIDAAKGLGAIHRVGLIHRDIKPGNLILRASGRLCVADLGVAGLAEGDPSPTLSARGEMVGTFDYAPPEVFDPKRPLDARSDLYSLGATLYHVVTGRLPHGSPSIFQTLIDMQTRAARWPADLPDHPPNWFVETILRLLARNPSERFDSPASLVAYLEHPRPGEHGVGSAPAKDPGLLPRGLTVLPFRNSGSEGVDDWLGFALADGLSRSLADRAGAYVVSHDQFAGMLARTASEEGCEGPAHLLRVGRLVGAGTIVEGSFTREGDELEIVAVIHQAGRGEALLSESLRGPLSRLVELQAALFDKVALLLGLTAPGGVAADVSEAVALSARERFVRGKQLYLKGDYEGAIELLQAAAEEEPDFVEPLQYVGACHARLGRYDQAAELHRRQIEMALQRDDKRLLVEAQANMGVMHYFKGEYDAAYGYYERAAELGESLGLTSELAQIHNNVGFVLFRLGRATEAEEAFLRAIETFKTYGALAALIGPYNGMGNVLLEQKRYEEARRYYRRALALALEVDDRPNIGLTYLHLGRVAVRQGNLAAAKSEYAMALNTLEDTSFWNGLSRAYEEIADMNLRLGNIDEALRCADKRIELARLHSNRRVEMAAWQQKAEALRQAGEEEEAELCLSRGREAIRRPDEVVEEPRRDGA